MIWVKPSTITVGVHQHLFQFLFLQRISLKPIPEANLRNLVFWVMKEQINSVVRAAHTVKLKQNTERKSILQFASIYTVTLGSSGYNVSL